MNVIVYGATGMVGQGVLRECLRAPDVARVLAIGRTALDQADPKLAQIVRDDLTQYPDREAELSGYDACFFCLGVSSRGLNEDAYARLTYDLTLAAAGILARLNPAMTFVYVSGAGTDGSERGGTMWARVKGRTENALRRLPFKSVYLLRPGIIQPLHGIRSKTALYRSFYAVAGPFLTVLRGIRPGSVLTTEGLGQVMLALARRGAPKPVLEAGDLAALAAQERP